MAPVSRSRFSLGRAWSYSLREALELRHDLVRATMLSLILGGAVLIRECEHGTSECLLVMPVAPVDIMLAKV